MLARWDDRGHVREAARAEQRRPDVLVHRRARHREQVLARRSHGLGANAEGRLPALQGAARLRPAVPERLRQPGALDRGRRRARARAQLEARDRGVRPRGVRAALPRRRRAVVGGADPRLDPARAVDGLGQGLLHLQRHEHRVRLANVEERPRAGLALHGAPFDRVVPAVRDVDLPARADRFLRRSRRPVALRPPAAARSRRRVSRRLDDDAVDAPGQRRGRGEPGGGVRPPRERGVGRGRPLPGRGIRGEAAGSGARRLDVPRPVRRHHRRSSIASFRGTRSRSTRARASSTSRRAAATRTSSSRRCTGSRSSSRSTSRGASTTASAGCTGSRPPRRRSRSSATSRRRASSSRPGCTSTAIPSAGAATRR